ncbi:hypothetical protein ACSX1A_05890 [Pontibacter sp. MBLB2868]|uniref:hypothetical protein n=1 Tax=Pontibacter sp. MBLB2868 TaxID=3451555 RepID=UPI003F74B687
MKAIELNENNSTLIISGSQATRSIDIKKVTVNRWPAADDSLKMLVLDEKDVPIYSQVMETSQARQGGTIEVDKRFVFYDHLSVQFITERENSGFDVTLNFI